MTLMTAMVIIVAYMLVVALAKLNGKILPMRELLDHGLH
jgi:hypothetical protein